jgi:hypothetical protein
MKNSRNTNVKKGRGRSYAFGDTEGAIRYSDLWSVCLGAFLLVTDSLYGYTLRKLANAPWYISNITLHNDLRIPYVTEVKRAYAKNKKNRTEQNNHQLIRDLFNQPEIGRRLIRMWPEDFIR